MQSHEHPPVSCWPRGTSASPPIHAETSFSTCTRPSSGAHEAPQTQAEHFPRSDDVLRGDGKQEEVDAPNFDCSICLDACYDPVVTMCGHLFCWPCLYHWLSCHSHSKTCPVCKETVENRVIPLYGRGRIACPDILADRFPGIHVPCRPVRPLLRTSELQFSSTDISLGARYSPGRRRDRHRVDHRHHAPSPRLGISGLCLDFLASLVPSDISHVFSGRTAEMGLLVRRQTFSNEKEFVLHWGFIVFALIAALGFILR